MICIITDPIDLGKYMEADNLRRQHPTQVTHFKWANFSGLHGRETLYLLAHGNGGSVEGMSADTLAQGLVQRGLRNPIHKIKLTSCGSGVTGGGFAPYCQRLADRLAALGGPRTVVVGFDGAFAATDEHGKTYAQDTAQSAYRNWNEFEANWGDLQATTEKKFAHWDAIAKSMKFGSEPAILSNIENLKSHVEAMFKWLYESNRTYNKERIAGKTYGIPGQVFR
jgi:hypothetical protein